MAFSFRVGTNWCHDFPKLARESGFYFNMHTARVRVDWNRISTIDIDRLIRERDFQTIDENINYVIDYYLESEYDVKILDPNFVKLFRLAQLAVEYLLYCKQYLDQSVVILKEELKFKLEENVKLKEELRSHQNLIRELKEKNKELSNKKNSSELKAESQGEIHQCPHCPKTFSAASYASAHILRRHANIELATASPKREEYKAETDKLHNEIKGLKERLNQTERLVRNDATKISTSLRENKSVNVPEAGDSTMDDHYRKYQEDMSDLKSLCTEIRNIKRKEIAPTQQESEAINENIKEVISQQESEIQRLRSQLQENLASNANEVESKLVKQEEFWKLKIDQLESQHRKDIDSLFAQLKLTQDSSVRMKSEYEDKVSFLEKQSIEQSKLLSAQTEQLNNITRGMMMHGYLAKRPADPERESNLSKKLMRQQSEYDSESSPKKSKQFLSSFKSKPSYSKLVASKKPEEPPIKDKNVDRMQRKVKYSSLEESEKSETATETETETDEDETTESEDSRTESTNDEVPAKDDKALKSESHKKRRSSLDYQNDIKEKILKDFECKLRDLGIDPEWNGVPIITYKQKIEGVKHHQNIAAKMFPKYEQIRKKILEEIAKKISTNQKSLTKDKDLERKSLFNKTVKNVKTKAMRAINEFKVQKGGNETSTSVASSRNSSPKDFHPRRKFSFELLPKKPTQQDIQEIRRQTRLDPEKKEKPSLKKEESPKISAGKSVTTEAVIEAPKRLQRSYLTIDDFMKDVTEAKVTSTPSKTTSNVLQDTYNETDSEGQLSKHEAMWALSSPRSSKSVLKSTGNASGSVKKKVLFDLEKDTNSEKKSRGVTEYLDDYGGQKELNDSDWNTSSTMSEEKEKISPKEKTGSTENIQLKTSQSEKIAEISRKIQEKLDASRRKPAGSIEAMFSAKTISGTDKEEVEVLNKRDSMDRLSTILESVSSHSGSKSRSTEQLPKPAPRRQLLFETKDLDKDIDDLLTNYR